MSKLIYKLKSEVWIHPGIAGWHFITVPKKDSEKIKEKHRKNSRGWGSLPVKVTIGKTSWTTSIFPDKKSGTYLLPLKAEVRKKEEIFKGDKIAFAMEIR